MIAVGNSRNGELMAERSQLGRTDAQTLSEVMAPVRRVIGTAPEQEQPDALERLCAIQHIQILRKLI